MSGKKLLTPLAIAEGVTQRYTPPPSLVNNILICALILGFFTGTALLTSDLCEQRGDGE